jgi:general secretion pathway protein L
MVTTWMENLVDQTIVQLSFVQWYGAGRAVATRIKGLGRFMTGTTQAQLSLLDGAMRFLHWWRDELYGLVPEAVRKLATGSDVDVVLAQVGGGFEIIAVSAPRVRDGTTEVLSRAQAIAVLVDMAMSRRLRGVGVRLPISQCLERCVELPRAARDDLKRILLFDLERATPFRRGDVYTAHLISGEPATKGKLRVRQIIVKRELIDSLLAALKAAGIEPAFVDCWEAVPSTGLSIDFLEADALPRTGLARHLTLSRVLTLLALALASLACVLWPSRYDAALAEITAQNAKLRAEAAAVQSAIDRSNTAVADLMRLQQTRLTRLPAVEVVEELTRLLPDSVWLTDFRIEGEIVDITGLSKSAAAIPSLLAGSPSFVDVTLSAPVTLDPREDRERFSLRLRLKQPEASTL